jgi:tetratricopeptide (TPR) repeat protein
MNHKILLRKKISICFVLAAITLLAYWPVQNHEFINFDDNLYVTGNHQVKAGLTLDGLIWAFDFNKKGYWQPLTWLSHMLDVELFGLNSTGHHLTNLWFHLANALLLFWILYRTTGCLYRSAFIAALFAVHPLNVDSVAWVAERKNLLSTFFWMLSLLFYVRYVERPKTNRYFLILVIFAMGLMVKPMLVTLPFVFLLLDYWPLKRLGFNRRQEHASVAPAGEGILERQSHALKLVLEKLPLLVLSGVSIGLSILSTQQMGIVVATDTVPMTLRIANALVSYLSYLVKMIWPHNMAIFYPFPQDLPLWQVAGSGVLLVTFTAIFLLRLTHKPYLAIGWLWYLGTLVPVIGIVQAGEWPSMADRWVYIPMIGIIMIITWALTEMTSKWRHKIPALAVLGISVLACCIVLVRIQLQYWENSRVLFTHALEITQENGIAHNNLGSALLWEGETTAALHQFKAALELSPNRPKIHNNIGHALIKLGRVDEAVDRYLESLQLNPLEAETHNSLAVAFIEQGRLAESILHLQKALDLEPNYADAYVNLGAAYRRQGQIKRAARCYMEAIRLRPDLPEAYNNLGLLLLREGKLKAAASYFSKALDKKPDYAAARDNLEKVRTARDTFNEVVAQIQAEIKRNPEDGDLFLKLGDLYKEQSELDDALKHYQKAFLLRPDSLPTIKKLAIVHAMQGRYDEAIELLNKMITLQPDDTEPYYYMAGIYSRQNNINASIAWLKKAIAKGYNNWDRLKIDRNFDNIRETSFFKALVTSKSI